LENELSQTSDPGGITSVQNKIIPLYKKLYELNRDPFILYRLGQIYVARNENQAAINSFEQAVKAYPSGTMYGDNSAKIVQKLKEKMQP
jgi:tetratricopeptide (TPR) repeat protein